MSEVFLVGIKRRAYFQISRVVIKITSQSPKTESETRQLMRYGLQSATGIKKCDLITKRYGTNVSIKITTASAHFFISDGLLRVLGLLKGSQ